MPRSVITLRPRSLRARFGLVLALLVGISIVNIGLVSWSGKQRDVVLAELQGAIGRHNTLNEARAWVDGQQQQVRTLGDLLGSGTEDPGPDEKRRLLAAVDAGRDSLLVDLAGTTDPELVSILEDAGSLAGFWHSFYRDLGRTPVDTLNELRLRADSIADRLLVGELPAAIRAQTARVQLAKAAFEASDRRWFRAVHTILLASVLAFLAISWSTSRALIGAIDALKTGADRFGSADLGYRVNVENFDELAEVGDRMNAMAGRLQGAHDELAVRNEELALLAFRDPLTKLSNRALFRERVEQALHGETGSVAVLLIDLDNFKAVNDTFGHNTGDRLLVDVAGRLLHTTRGCDTVARLGGDEFAILLDAEQAIGLAVADRCVASLRRPFDVDDRTIHVGASIGLAWSRDCTTADDLVRNADVAMYAAKENGRGCYRVFAPEMHAALVDRAELEAALRVASRNGEFELQFQPIVELATESIVGYEALIRWTHPDRGAIPPAVFIPMAEQCGVILPIGRWVLRQACIEAARWEQMLPAVPITVSVNVSSQQLEHPDFVHDLKAALSSSGLSAERLVLEITESVIMRDSALNLERLRQMKRIGVRLAIDDFGTGFSSLAYLQRFPVDVIKIDKAFVNSVAISANDAALARTIIMLSETLRLKTVAEGIEYPDQKETLRSLGCTLGQGFLFSAAVPASEIRASLRSHARVAKAMGTRGGAGVHIGLTKLDVHPSIDLSPRDGKFHSA